jgi:hypothetical protein
VKNLKPLGPRVSSLSGGLDSKDPVMRMSAISELALLVSCSGAARDAVAAGQIENKLLKVLSRTSDSNGQCYIMSILSNLADNQASRERQVTVVPALATLLKSHSPEVRHAAALHLARLSHSDLQRQALSKSGGLRLLHSMEAEEDMRRVQTLPTLGHSRSSGALAGRIRPSDRHALLLQETAQYARWTLRSAQGRNYKPSLQPKSAEAYAEETAAVNLQKHERGRGQRAELRAKQAAKVALDAREQELLNELNAIAVEVATQAPTTEEAYMQMYEQLDDKGKAEVIVQNVMAAVKDVRPEASGVIRSIQPEHIELDLSFPSSNGEVVKLRLTIACEQSPEQQAANLVQSVMAAVMPGELGGAEQQAAALVQNVLDAVMDRDFTTPRNNASQAELDAASSLLQAAAAGRMVAMADLNAAAALLQGAAAGRMVAQADLDAAAALLQGAAAARHNIELELAFPSSDGQDVKLALLL